MSCNLASIRHCIVGLCVLACAPTVLAENCQLERIAEVDMSVTKGGQAVVPVEINGIRVMMAIDTAGSLTSIYSGATAALNLRPKNNLRSGVLHIGAISPTQSVDITPLKMANINWRLVNVLVYPLTKSYPPLLGEDDVVGFLGQGLFMGNDLELDFGAHKLRLYSQKHCPGAVVYWSKEFDVLPLEKDRLGDSFITMSANGKRMLASMASLMATSSMEEDVARKELGLDRSSAGFNATGGSDGCMFCGSITLQAQGLKIENARVKLVQTVGPNCHLNGSNFVGGAARYGDCYGAYPLHLGMNVLSRLHLYFAYGERKLYFTAANVNTPDASIEPAASVPAAR
jgi:hypothetical protein